MVIIAVTFISLIAYRLFSRKLSTPALKHEFSMRYLLWPAITLVVVDVGESLTYNGTRAFTENVPHHNFGTPLDAALPLIPFFIIFYLMAYLVILFAPFYLSWVGNIWLVQRYLASVVVLFVISSIIYLTLPNDVPHAWTPEQYAQHTGPFDRLLEFMYDSDAASNGLPSLHNAHIWLPFFLIVFSMAKGRQRLLRALPVAILGVLISLSTLFCKEHYLADVFFSIALVALIAWCATHFGKRPARVHSELKRAA
jgi:membrane-associated phospholipid phosphatase